MDLFPTVYPIDMNMYGSFFIYKMLINFFWLLFGVGMVLASFGYRGLREKYGVLFGNVGFVFGLVASVFTFSTAVVGLLTPDYMILIYPPLIYSIYSLVRLFNVVFFGLTQIVWGIAHFKFKKFSEKPGVGLITSVLFVVSGVAILSIFYVDIGFVLSFVGLLFASRVFSAF